MIRILPCHNQQIETEMWKEKIIGLVIFVAEQTTSKTFVTINIYYLSHFAEICES